MLNHAHDLLNEEYWLLMIRPNFVRRILTNLSLPYERIITHKI